MDTSRAEEAPEGAAPTDLADRIGDSCLRERVRAACETGAARADSAVEAAARLSDSLDGETDSGPDLERARRATDGQAAAETTPPALVGAVRSGLSRTSNLRRAVRTRIAPADRGWDEKRATGGGSQFVLDRVPRAFQPFVLGGYVARSLTVSTGGDGLCGWARRSLEDV